MIEHDPLIAEYSHEKFRPREAEALRALQKVASMVKPIMRQRGWKVGVLTEFYPSEQNLLGLNWNRGQKICLRLRYPGDERQFLPLEHVLDTMMHELCHIVHGPHNDAFHKLWNQLRDEHESLLRKGYTGEGFLSTGHKLGGGRIPMHEARRKARAAAEQRRVQSAGSGQKLGGRAVNRGEDIRRVIADAAQRRINISKGCAAVGDDTKRKAQIVEEASRNGFKTKAEEENANEQAIMQAYIELIQEDEREKYGKDYVQPSSENPAGSQGVAAEPVKQEPGRSAAPPVPMQSKPPPKQTTLDDRRRSSPPVKSEPHLPLDDYEPSMEFWSCAVCTLNNTMSYLCCDACGSERPPLYDTAATTPTATTPPPPSAPPQKQATTSRQSNPPPARTAQSTPPTDATRPRIPPPARSAAAARAADAAAARSRKESGLRNLATLYAAENQKPLGWVCQQCGNFMESEWWTCAGCGAMKQAS